MRRAPNYSSKKISYINISSNEEVIDDLPYGLIDKAPYENRCEDNEDIKHMARYVNGSCDPAAQKAWRNLRDGEKIPSAPPSVLLRDIVAMSCDGFVEDLKRPLDRLLPGTPVSFLAPELSRMNDNNPQELHNFIADLRQGFPGLEFRGISLNDTTHNVLAANPAYFGQMIELGKPKH